MTPAPEVLRPDSEVADAARVMLGLGVRHLPIMGAAAWSVCCPCATSSVPTNSYER